MIVYSSNKKEFMDHVENDYIACAIDEFYRDKIVVNLIIKSLNLGIILCNIYIRF